MRTRRWMIIVVGSVLASGLALWRCTRPRDGSPAGGGPARVADGDATGSARSDGASVGRRDAPPAPITTVTRLPPEARARLGAQIAAARRRAAEVRVGDAGVLAGPDLADVVIPLERVAAPAQAALQDSIAVLADCYAQGPTGAPRAAMAMMTLTSDPELGTVIDTSAITDGTGQALPRELDDCLRDRIDSLALPPLGEGGKLPLQYTFTFDDVVDAGAPP